MFFRSSEAPLKEPKAEESVISSRRLGNRRSVQQLMAAKQLLLAIFLVLCGHVSAIAPNLHPGALVQLRPARSHLCAGANARGGAPFALAAGSSGIGGGGGKGRWWLRNTAGNGEMEDPPPVDHGLQLLLLRGADDSVSGFDATLEATHGQILSQSPTDATRFWWHLYGS